MMNSPFDEDGFYKDLSKKYYMPESQLKELSNNGIPLYLLTETDRYRIIRANRCRHQETSLVAKSRGHPESLQLACLDDCGGHMCVKETIREVLEKYYLRRAG